ncbi:MAG: 3-hydroxyacyl-CoA dehydrogenase family protein [Gammaproteobacteria bacterium]|nr:3-hydroxyacyl-CoA dehydrogenase family protein [Gammaproteobacteria bacterium]
MRKIGVAGAGTMGAGIAIVGVRAGFETVLFDLQGAALERARSQIEAFLQASVRKKKLTEQQADAALGRLQCSPSISELAECDLVIEAVFEDLAVKIDLFRKLDGLCPESTILATNTSTLSVTEIAGGTGRPDRVVGMHFCLPAQLMKLVEVTPGLITSDETLAKAWALCENLGQEAVQTRDSPGFVLNHFLVPFNNDAIRLVEQAVAEPAEIDRAVKQGLGYPMGPCELLDLIGLDTQIRLCEALYPVTLDPRVAAPPLLRRMVAAGHLGRKSGRGFFDYEGHAMFGAER